MLRPINSFPGDKLSLSGRSARLQQVLDTAYLRVTRAKIDLEDSAHEAPSAHAEAAQQLIAERLALLAASPADHTVFFRELCPVAEDPAADARATSLFAQPLAFHTWAKSWRDRWRRAGGTPAARAESMRRANPASIPRNHRIEEAIATGTRDDFATLAVIRQALARPYDDQPEFAYLAEPPAPEERVQAASCGT